MQAVSVISATRSRADLASPEPATSIPTAFLPIATPLPCHAQAAALIITAVAGAHTARADAARRHHQRRRPFRWPAFRLLLTGRRCASNVAATPATGPRPAAGG
jgi:hypothetical protein